MYEVAFVFEKRSVDATDNDDLIDFKDAMYDEFKDTLCRACLSNSKINLHKFCMALPSNLVFSKGFEMDRPCLVIIVIVIILVVVIVIVIVQFWSKPARAHS